MYKKSIITEMAAEGLFEIGWSPELKSYFISNMLCRDEPYLVTRGKLLQLAEEITHLANFVIGSDQSDDLD
jgi:hypothetical protein